MYCVWLATLLCFYVGALLYTGGLGFFSMVQVIRVVYTVSDTDMEIVVVPSPSTQYDFGLAVGF